MGDLGRPITARLHPPCRGRGRGLCETDEKPADRVKEAAMRRRLRLTLVIIAMETPRGRGCSSKHAANLRVSRPERSSTVAHSAPRPPFQRDQRGSC